jgi:hypothetical protein
MGRAVQKPEGTRTTLAGGGDDDDDGPGASCSRRHTVTHHHHHTAAAPVFLEELVHYASQQAKIDEGIKHKIARATNRKEYLRVLDGIRSSIRCMPLSSSRGRIGSNRDYCSDQFRKDLVREKAIVLNGVTYEMGSEALFDTFYAHLRHMLISFRNEERRLPKRTSVSETGGERLGLKRSSRTQTWSPKPLCPTPVARTQARTRPYPYPQPEP